MNDGYTLQTPTIAVHSPNHSVAVGFVRLRLNLPSDAFDPEQAISNSAQIGTAMHYHFGVSSDQARSPWVADRVDVSVEGQPLRAPSIVVGSGSCRFLALPAASLVHDPATSAWAMAFPTAVRADFSGGVRQGLFVASTVDGGSSWRSLARLSPASAFGPPPSAIFPRLIVNRNDGVLALAWMQSDLGAENSWRPWYATSADGGISFSAALPIAPASTPQPVRVAHQPLYQWGGHWTQFPRAGYFGDYIGFDWSGTQYFLSWQASHESRPGDPRIDVHGRAF